ncbi:MAG: dipeptide epimerase [Bacteroidetes bacterium]|nr:dipeptide epimerase [Bacteroidota bacterium]
MKYQCYPYRLQFKNPFVLSSGTRTFTPSVFLRVEQDDFAGWGEATMPPYVSETQQSVIGFIEQMQVAQINHQQTLHPYLEYLYAQPGNFFAKAAVGNALIDWWTQKQNITPAEFFEIEHKNPLPDCCFTITKGDDLIKKLAEAKNFSLLKIKAGFDDDIDFIKSVADVTSARICIDANRGWSNAATALKKMKQLEGLTVAFIEQPLPVDAVNDMRLLKQHSPFTLIADESFQTMDDLEKIADSFHGINIKLMKCGGVWQAHRIAVAARKAGMKLLLGCMSESSCGVAAAASLQPLMDWVDLDGPLLISNDPFTGIKYVNGKVITENDIQARLDLLQMDTLIP